MSQVTLKTFSTRIEAEIARSKLNAFGIESHISADDAGGMIPAPMSASPGVRLKVSEEDREKALKVFETSKKN